MLVRAVRRGMSNAGIIREPGEVFDCANVDVALVDEHPHGVGWMEPVADVDRQHLRAWRALKVAAEGDWDRPRDPHAHPPLRSQVMRPGTIMDGTLPDGTL